MKTTHQDTRDQRQACAVDSERLVIGWRRTAEIGATIACFLAVAAVGLLPLRITTMQHWLV